VQAGPARTSPVSLLPPERRQLRRQRQQQSSRAPTTTCAPHSLPRLHPRRVQQPAQHLAHATSVRAAR
jgi:hypothetical protein